MADAPLRILLWYWGRRGGGPRYTLELARALAQRPGVELHLSLSQQSELFAETDGLGLPGFHVDTYRNLAQFALRSALLPLFARRLRRYLKEHRIDIVYNTMDFLWGSALAPQVRRAGALYLLAVHDAERHPGEQSIFREVLLKRDIRSADGIVTMTRSVRQRFLDLYEFPSDRVWTAPLGVHLARVADGPRSLRADQPVRILFFGRILPYKGLDLLLEAVRFLQERGRAVELQIWGSGSLAQYDSLLSRVSDVRIENRWITEDEFEGIFAGADICALSHREASQSGVIAASLAAGVPIVTTPIAGLVEQLDGGKAGAVARDFTPAAFADALDSLSLDQDRYRAASVEGLRIARGELSWTSIASQVEMTARDLLRLGPRSRKQ